MLETVAELLNLLELTVRGTDAFEGTQPDSPNHHIVGGHIAAQSLMAASRTVPGRTPHSLHVYFLRRGDARQPVRFDVTRLHDGGTFSARRVAATQGGQILMEGLASFTSGADGADYQTEMPSAPAPEELVPVEEQLAPYAGEFGGRWAAPRPFDTRYIDPPPRIAIDHEKPAEALSRIWLRSRGEIPADPVVASCVLTYLSALTLLEPAMRQMERSPMDVSALLDHTVWFHRFPQFADWLYYEQKSPSGIGGRALVTGAIYNRSGGLICTAGQEGYFPGRSI
ncbi:acyl-CoA thioesterase II [Mycolicibacterium duvalii]|uniref:Acyl-CoA thioesterase II n=1 Tax=Mycolicibacterium duvalii TaxID=39688 RepID=A0A7I7JYJ7_9MYCO|nr:acyl-CoA thioesterase domain-containing protein [Mycolicibacterium duvalii]MCV7370729.1 thioesterase family protein [Mycolicibacterium duvalii]PEG37897.1 acyl-CoA thioesterase II [Mycolicibacterium duvalii]BBX16970.1 acyl-CoA thioesterase II [Mycolicibacterium duvalii]